MQLEILPVFSERAGAGARRPHRLQCVEHGRDPLRVLMGMRKPDKRRAARRAVFFAGVGDGRAGG